MGYETSKHLSIFSVKPKEMYFSFYLFATRGTESIIFYSNPV